MDIPKLPYSRVKNQYVVSKFPRFWRIDPVIWFMQVEAFFTINSIEKESDKFTVLVANVDDSVLPYITDIIHLSSNQSEMFQGIYHVSLNQSKMIEEKYRLVKERILKVFGKDDKTRLRELIRDKIHVVERPSQLLQAMLATGMGRDGIADLKLIKSLFIEMVSDKFSCHLSEKDSIPAIGTAADRLAVCDGKWTISGFWKDQ